MKKLFIVLILGLIFSSCGGNEGEKNFNPELESRMNTLAEKYIKLVLRIGKFDPDYVDAYYGPAELQEEVDREDLEQDTLSYVKLDQYADELLNELESLSEMKANQEEVLRYRFMYKQLLAVKGRIFMLRGGTLTFEEEAKALYDAEPPVNSLESFQKVLDEIDRILPGSGSLEDRVAEFRSRFAIPPDKIDPVFKAAVEECRKRTQKNIKLPENENFKIEYVTDKPWSGYNWYKGNSFSLIQVNTGIPVYIDRAVDLAAHEGYPGHHVYNVLIEQHLVKDNKWMEFTVYPLFSPQSLIAEGTATFGINVAFPGNERKEFEKRVLFPMAGFDTSLADKYYQVQELVENLSYASNEATRNYLNGKWDRNQTLDFLMKYTLSSPDKAERNLKFIEKYRSYMINYNLGEDIVRNYVIKKGGTDANPSMRWKIFEYLLKTPQTPSSLK
jgi:hypothetical protein